MSSLPPLFDPPAPRPPSDPALHNGVLDGLARIAATLTHTSIAVLCQVVDGELRVRARFPSGGGLSRAAAGALVSGLCAHVVREAETLSLESARTDLRFHRALASGALEVDAFLGVPLPTGSGGALAVAAPAPHLWTEDDTRSLYELAAAAASELEREALVPLLAQSERRYERLLATTPDAIYSLDRTGRFREINGVGEEILGLPTDQVIGRPFSDFVAPEDLPLAERMFREALAGGGDRSPIEVRLVRPSGERRLLQICRAPATEADVGIGIARDITDDRAREMQFRRAERMTSVAPLLSSVCHELNNPLTSIKSFAELMLLDERPGEDREALEIVQREADRAAKIVSDLRTVVRQARETGSGRGLVELNALVTRILEQRRSAIGAAGIQVHLHLTEGLPPVWAVEVQVEQVLHQLIANAEQALRDHGGPRLLTIRSHRGSIGVALHVEDSGPGIPREHLDRIFDPFWTTRRPGEGTGLGLSLIHGIVSDHGGSIRVDSAPGRGAAFTVDLPTSDESPAALGGAETESPSMRPLRLLVVDDEAPIRFSLQRYMERRGHQVAQAAEGEAALELLAASTADPSFDIILADLRMPGLDGERLLQRLRDRGDGMHQRVIFITGDQDSPDAARVLEGAGVPVVQKPFELAEIAQIIEAHAGMLAAF